MNLHSYKLNPHGKGWRVLCTQCRWVSPEHPFGELKEAFEHYHQHTHLYYQRAKPLDVVLAEKKQQGQVLARQRALCARWGHTLKPLKQRTKPYVACLLCGSQIQPKVTLATSTSGTS